MNPYLDRLKMQKPILQPLTELPEATYVSFVSASGRGFPEIDMPCVSFVSDRGRAFSEIDMVREFMEIDGLSLEEARALAAVSIPPRPPAELLAMIAELDQLIDRYCAAAHLSQEAAARLKAARNTQAIASIPESLAWFRRALSGEKSER